MIFATPSHCLARWLGIVATEFSEKSSVQALFFYWELPIIEMPIPGTVMRGETETRQT